MTIPEFPKLPTGVQAWRVCSRNSEQKEEFVSFKWLICSFLISEVSLTKCYVTQPPSRRFFKGLLTSFIPSLNQCWWGTLFSAMYLLFVSYKQGSRTTGCLGERSKKVSFIPLASCVCLVPLVRLSDIQRHLYGEVQVNILIYHKFTGLLAGLNIQYVAARQKRNDNQVV